MSDMNNSVLRMVRALSIFPKPVAIFILDRILKPMTLMVAAVAMSLVFVLLMALVFVVAPFNPEWSRAFWFKVLQAVGE